MYIYIYYIYIYITYIYIYIYIYIYGNHGGKKPNYTFSKILRLLPLSVASIILPYYVYILKLLHRKNDTNPNS